MYQIYSTFNIMMSIHRFRFIIIYVYISIGSLIQITRADIGLGSQYLPPYTPTACYGNDLAQFPTSNLFAAAGEGIWDNGAACGRQYLVRCISGPLAESCVPDQTIQVTVVDRALTSSSRPSRDGSSLVLSNTAYETIAVSSPSFLNIEFQQVSR